MYKDGDRFIIEIEPHPSGDETFTIKGLGDWDIRLFEDELDKFDRPPLTPDEYRREYLGDWSKYSPEVGQTYTDRKQFYEIVSFEWPDVWLSTPGVGIRKYNMKFLDKLKRVDDGT